MPANDGGSPLIRTSEYIRNSSRVIGDLRLSTGIGVDLPGCMGQRRQRVVRAERLGDWMGVAAGLQGRARWRSAVVQVGFGTGPRPVRRHARGAAIRSPPR